MRIMLRVQKARRQAGKASAFIVRGRPVDPKKLSRFLQRKGCEDDLAHDISKGQLIKECESIDF